LIKKKNQLHLKIKMKLLIVFALISLAAAVPAPDGMPEKSCEDLTMTVEKGLKRLSLVDGTPPPMNAAELEARCNEGKVLFKDFKAYKKCLKSNKLTEQIFATSTKSIGEILKEHCGTPEAQKKLLSVIQCVPENKLTEIRAASAGTLQQLQKLANSADDKATLLPKVCCLSHVSVQATSQRLEGVQCPGSTITPQQHFEQLFKSLNRDAMELSCGDYKSLMDCEAKVPAVVAELKSGVESNKDTMSNLSILDAALKLSDKIAS